MQSSHFPTQVYIKDQVGETYELMSQVTREEAALIRAQLGVEMIDVDNPWEVKNHPGKIVFVKGDMFSNAILGEGNFSQFALARHVYTKKYVGVKIIRKEKAKRSSQREYEFASHFKNTPHMLVPFASTKPTTPDEPLYMLTEVAALGTLEDIIEYLPSLSDELRSMTEAQIVKSILLILFNLENNRHSDKRFAHCDFHPGNIFIGAKGQLLLGDWGCAVELNEKDNFIRFDYQNGRWIGTGKKSYWSPARWEAVAAYENNNIEENWFDASYEDRFGAAIIIAQVLLGKKIVKVNPSSHPPLTADAILNQLQAAGCNEKLTAIVEALLRKEKPLLIETLLNLKQMCNPALHLSDTHSAAFYLLKQAAIHAKPTEKHLYENKLKDEKPVMREDYHDSEEEVVEREDYHEVNNNNMPKKYDYHEDEIEDKCAEREDYHGLPTEAELKIKLDGKQEVNFDLTKDDKIIANFSEVFSSKNEDNHEEDIQQHLEFDLQVVNWAKQYYAELVTFLKTELAASYIDLNATFDPNGADSFELHEVVKKYLQDAKAHTLVLMGEGGAGKTTYQKLLAALLARELLDQLEKGERLTTLPLLIILRDIQSPHAVIEEFLRKQGFSSNAIEYIRQRYRLNLLLDGYDEFKDRYDNFSITNEWHRWKLKCLYTTRRSNLKEKPIKYFLPSQKTGQENVFVGYQELYLLPLDNTQIKKFISKYVAINEAALKMMSDSHRLDEKWLRKETYLEILNNIESANEILTKPYLLYLFLKTVPHLSSSQLNQGIRQIELYREYAKQTVNTNVDKFTDLSGMEKEKLNKDVLAYTQYLAEHFYEKNLSQLSFKIEFRFDAAKGNYQPKDASLRIFLQYYRYLPMNVSRLEDDKINVSFPHLTLLHYFIAESWLQQLSNLMPNKILTDDEAKKFFNASCFEKLKLVTLNQHLVATDVKARPILNFIAEAIQQDEGLKEFLFRIIQSSAKNKEIDNLSANLATILVLSKYDFSRKNLAGVNLSFADLRQMKAQGTNLDDANLSFTDIRGADLFSASLPGANLFNVVTGMQLQGPEVVDRAIDGFQKRAETIENITCSSDGSRIGIHLIHTYNYGDSNNLLKYHYYGIWDTQFERFFYTIERGNVRSKDKEDIRSKNLVAMSSDGNFIVYALENPKRLKILFTKKNEQGEEGFYWSYIPDPSKEVKYSNLCTVNDGLEAMALCAIKDSLKVMAVATVEGKIHVFDIGELSINGTIKFMYVMKGLDGVHPLKTLAFNSNGFTLVASAGNEIFFWNLLNHQLTGRLACEHNDYVAFSHNDEYLVTVSNQKILFFNLRQHKFESDFDLPPLAVVNKVIFSTNGKYLMVGLSMQGVSDKILILEDRKKAYYVYSYKGIFSFSLFSNQLVLLKADNKKLDFSLLTEVQPKFKFKMLDEIIYPSHAFRPVNFYIDDSKKVIIRGKNSNYVGMLDMQDGQFQAEQAYLSKLMIKKRPADLLKDDAALYAFVASKKDYKFHFASEDKQWLFLSASNEAGLEIWHFSHNKCYAKLPHVIADTFDVSWQQQKFVGMSHNRKQIFCWEMNPNFLTHLASLLTNQGFLKIFTSIKDLSAFVKHQWTYSAGLTLTNANMKNVKGITLSQANFFKKQGVKGIEENIMSHGHKKSL